MASGDLYMPVFIGDYLRDTQRLTTEQHGAYLLILFDYWINGAPPDDDEVLAAITKLPLPRWRKVRTAIEGFFRVEGKRWRQKRTEEELAAAEKKIAQSSAAGKASAEAKRRRREQQDGQRNGNGRSTDVATEPPTERQRGTNPPTPPPPPTPPGLPNPPLTTAANPREGGAEPGGSGPVERIRERFLALRSELWPHESALPAPIVTLEAQARQWLEQGGTVELICEVVERGMRAKLAKNETAPGSLKAFGRSVPDAIARHNSGMPGAPPTAAKKSPTEYDDRMWRALLDVWERQKRWHKEAGPEPGAPGCLVPPALLAEFGLAKGEAA